jgi:hypothetical protein
MKFEHAPVYCSSLEDARNQALARLESLAGPLGGNYKVHVGNLGALAGAAVGVQGSDPYRRIRLDFDYQKGPHYNVEFKGQSYAYCFPYNDHTGQGPQWPAVPAEERAAVEAWMKSMGERRGSR